MGFPWILQRYIFREMRSTFVLTTLALTGVLSLGGGVLNMIKLGEVTPAQFVRLMLLLFPVALALTLPIAALFSAASTYGRISADNEFTACRSSGINLHLLLLPTVVLSLVSACITLAFVNAVIPRMVRNLNEFLGSDVTALIQQRISRPRGLTLGGKYRIHADEVLTSSDEPSRIVLQRVAFVEVEGQDWVRFGTARQVDLKVDQDEQQIRVSGAMGGLSFYDRKAGRFADSEEEQFPRVELPALVPPQVKFLTWGELCHFRANPEEWPDVREAVLNTRSALGRRLLYDALLEEWVLAKQFSLGDHDSFRLIVRAERAGRIPQLGGIELGDVTVEEIDSGRRRILNAERAVLETSGTLGEALGIQVEMRPEPSEGRPPSLGTRETLGPVAAPAALTARLQGLTDEQVVEGATGEPEDETIAKHREQTSRIRGAVVRRITGTLHERLAFSASVLVLVVLGGALGIILRGSHVLTAFGISFLPLVFVIIAIVAGRQMANNASTHTIGLSVMWGGIALVAALDFWTVGRVLRR